MNTSFSSLALRAGIISGTMLLLSGLQARAQANKQTDAFPTYDSYIKITGQAADVTGNKAAFQNRMKQPSNGGVGIEDLHMMKDLSKTTNLVFDGKALTGSEDYLAQLKLTNSKVGSVDAGYKRFRTFYDGAGGFFPLNKQWMTLTPEALHLDRSKLWLEATLALPDMPTFMVRYASEQRNGKKDTTILGSSDLTGLPFAMYPNPISPVRKIAPAYIDVDEERQELELTVKHTIMNTELELRLFSETTDNNDARTNQYFPGEVIPWSVASLSTTVNAATGISPQNAAKALLAATTWNNQIVYTTTDAMKTTASGISAEAVTAFTESIKLHVGGIYELVHSTDGGDRQLVTTTPTATGPVPVTTYNIQGLNGSSKIKEVAGNVRLEFKPAPTLSVKVGLRLGSEWIAGRVYSNVVAASGTPATTLTTTPRKGWSKIQQNVTTPEWDLRFTGIKNVSVYFTGNIRNLTGHESALNFVNYLTASTAPRVINNLKEDHKNFTLGANWQVSPSFSLRGEVFQKDHNFTSIGYASRVGDYYLLDLTSTGYKITALAKPSATLGFTTRFVAQHNDGKVTGYLPFIPEYDSLKGRSYAISESIDWNPTTQVYFQLNGTVNYNYINTVYPRAGVTPAAAISGTTPTLFNRAWDTNQVLQNANNNNVTFSAISGFVVDKDTDAQLQVTYYRADNGDAALAAYTMPYGVAVKDTTITVGLKHKFSGNWIGHAKLGYFDSANDTTGGMTSYHGPMAYLSLEHAL